MPINIFQSETVLKFWKMLFIVPRIHIDIRELACFGMKFEISVKFQLVNNRSWSCTGIIIFLCCRFCLALTHLPLDKMAAILADDIFKCIFLNENDRISIQISLKFVPKSSINNKPVLVQVMACRRTGKWCPFCLRLNVLRQASLRTHHPASLEVVQTILRVCLLMPWVALLGCRVALSPHFLPLPSAHGTSSG